jgi:hypothetical protein
MKINTEKYNHPGGEFRSLRILRQKGGCRQMFVSSLVPLPSTFLPWRRGASYRSAEREENKINLKTVE